MKPLFALGMALALIGAAPKKKSVRPHKPAVNEDAAWSQPVHPQEEEEDTPTVGFHDNPKADPKHPVRLNTEPDPIRPVKTRRTEAATGTSYRSSGRAQRLMNARMQKSVNAYRSRNRRAMKTGAKLPARRR